MTDRKLDERLAGALGWEIAPGGCLWVKSPEYGVIADFSPSTSVDALRKWVLPELKRRGLGFKFGYALPERGSEVEDPELELLTLPTAVLAAAALAVLDDDNA